MIVGLRNKAGTMKERESAAQTDGFFVNYDPKTDGDTVSVPDQKAITGRKVIPIAKASLRTAQQQEVIDDGKERQALLDTFSPELKAKLQKAISTSKDAYGIPVGRFEGKEEQRLKMIDGRANSVYTKAFEAEFPKSKLSAETIQIFVERSGRFGDYDELNVKPSLRTAPDTPEFKRFFGDSRVVNADGTPKVLYHGSARDIGSFKRKTDRGVPIFLTDDPTFAEKFSKDSMAWMTAHPDQFLTETQIKEGRARAIVAIRKDFKQDTQAKEMIDSLKSGAYGDATAEAQEYLRKAYKDMMPSGPNIVAAYVKAEKPFDYQNPEHVKDVLATIIFAVTVPVFTFPPDTTFNAFVAVVAVVTVPGAVRPVNPEPSPKKRAAVIVPVPIL
jgi:hypothetical protein